MFLPEMGVGSDQQNQPVDARRSTSAGPVLTDLDKHMVETAECKMDGSGTGDVALPPYLLDDERDLLGPPPAAAAQGPLTPLPPDPHQIPSTPVTQAVDSRQVMPQLLEENRAGTIFQIAPNTKEVVNRMADSEMQLASCSVFLQILQRDLVPIQNYTQTFLQTILMCMENKDAEISKVWLDTLLDVIDLLPKEIVSKEILTKAVAKGQLSQSVQSRLASCKILGKAVTKFEPIIIKRDILPVVLALCQDVDFEVRACMSRLLVPVARGLGLEDTRSAILPALVELINDDYSYVRLAGLDTIISILTLLDNDAKVSTVIPLMTKYCQIALCKRDETLVAISKHFGSLCQCLGDNLTGEQKKYFIDVYRKLCCTVDMDPRKSNVERDCGDACTSNVDFESANQQAKRPMSAVLSDGCDAKEPDQGSDLDKCRQYAAVNFPAMATFVGADTFRSELAASFSQLCGDSDCYVRQAVASGFLQVAKQQGEHSYLLLPDLIALLNDSSVEVFRNGFVRTLPELFVLLHGSCATHSNDSTFVVNLLPALRSCEAVLFAFNNWRLQEEFLRCLTCLTDCVPSDVIYDQIVHLLFNKLQTVRALPVKRATVHALLVLMRSNRRREQRLEICRRLVDELARSRSFYKRSLFIDVCSLTMELYSRAFFKEHFLEAFLALCDDSVPNIRMRWCRLLPQVNNLLQLPGDRAIGEILEMKVNRLKVDERDIDVKDVLRQAVYVMDHQPILIESHYSRDKDDELDRRKELEEARLLELEIHDRKVEEDKLKGDKTKDKDKQATSKLPTPKKGTKPATSPQVTATINKGLLRSATPPIRRKTTTTTTVTTTPTAAASRAATVTPASVKPPTRSNGLMKGATSTQPSATHAVAPKVVMTRKNSLPSLVSATNTTTATATSTVSKTRSTVGAAASAVKAGDKRITQRRVSIGAQYPLDRKK